MALFHRMFAGLGQRECIAAFDPSYISKSGKKTYGLSKYWSGTAQKAKKGLEAGCLALVDVKDAAAYSMEVVQKGCEQQRRRKADQPLHECDNTKGC